MPLTRIKSLGITDGTITAADFASGVGGKVLQVVSTAKTDTFTSSTTGSFIDITGLSLSITPSSASNKILVLANVMGSGVAATNNVLFKMVRNSTDINVGASSGSRTPCFSVGQDTGDSNQGANNSGSFLDSPNTTSAITYKIQALSNASTMYINRTPNDGDANYTPRGCSTITAIEIAP